MWARGWPSGPCCPRTRRTRRSRRWRCRRRRKSHRPRAGCGTAVARWAARTSARARARRGPRTTPRARSRRPSPTARSGSAGPRGRRARARPPSPAAAGPPRGRRRMRAFSRVHDELRDLLTARLELDLELAVDLRGEREADLPAGLDVLHEVVAVHVDLVAHVGLHVEADLVALAHGDRLDAADRLGILDDDVRHRR